MQSKHLVVRNKDGMEAILAHLAADRYGQELHFLSMVGSLTAVKAIWASIQGGKNVQVAGNTWMTLSPDKQDKWITIKGMLYGGKMRHWIMVRVPQLAMDYPILPIWKGNGSGLAFIPDPEQWEEQGDKARTLVEYLKLYTLWPVIPEWGEALWEAGMDTKYTGRKLIRSLDTYNLPWAYAVNSMGWDQLIDELVKEGEISIGTSS
jgi:hypothetical protein